MRAKKATVSMALTDHDGGPVGGSLRPVCERPRDREVPVEADDEQVEDRGVAGQVVQGEPRVTDVRSQGPVPEDCVHCEQRHGDEADSEVRDCEAEEEVVADRLQLLVDLERDHHHGVAHHRDETQCASYNSQHHHLGDGEATWPLGHRGPQGGVEHPV